MKRAIQTFLISVLLTSSFSSLALSDQDSPAVPATPQITPTKPGLHFVLNGGLTYGGDTIATAIYDNGSSTDIKGGGLLQFGAGCLYQLVNQPLALLLSVNYQFHSASGTTGSISFGRMPIEALAYYTGKERFRIGGGVRMVKSPEYISEVSSPAYPVKQITFDDTTGLVAEIGYQLSSQSWLNFRFVSEKYQGKTMTLWNNVSGSIAGSSPLSGSHLGVNYSYEF